MKDWDKQFQFGLVLDKNKLHDLRKSFEKAGRILSQDKNPLVQQILSAKFNQIVSKIKIVIDKYEKLWESVEAKLSTKKGRKDLADKLNRAFEETTKEIQKITAEAKAKNRSESILYRGASSADMLERRMSLVFYNVLKVVRKDIGKMREYLWELDKPDYVQTLQHVLQQMA